MGHEGATMPHRLNSSLRTWSLPQICSVAGGIVLITASVAMITLSLNDSSDTNALIDTECRSKGMDSLFVTAQATLKMCVREDGTLVLPDARRPIPKPAS